jgi:lysophospholipase L1-like esterase
VELFSKAIAENKQVTFVGRSMNGPSMVAGVSFPRNHEGHSGFTIAQIDDMVPTPALEPGPHIVLLHLGTNDMSRMAAGAPDRLAKLIDQILTRLPNALLVVATIIPFPGASRAVETFNAAIPAIVKTRADAGQHVILVDQYTGFPASGATSELGDGVHPNQAGYARMAGLWYTAIRPYLR